MTPVPDAFATLVICTYDRRASLGETLDSVATQRSEELWDVLVVDNNSSDGTAEYVERRAKDFPVRLHVIREERQGRSFALNRAIDSSRSEILIFTDDDVTLRPGFVAAHCGAYRDGEVMGAGGRILPIMPDNTPAWMRPMAEGANGGLAGRYDWGDDPRAVAADGNIHLPYGANMSLRRRTARDVGGFRTDLGWGKTFVPGEENELFQRVLGAGGKVVYRPDAVALHRFQPEKATLEYFLRYELG
jgi:glycosyltransferase involved in cell wall biosynthesis